MVIGLTGGIGCGKSTVAKLFEQLNCDCFDTDIAVRNSAVELKDQIIKVIGPDAFINSDLNSEYVAKRIFSSSELREQLNQIYLPVIKRKIQEFITKSTSTIKIVESALLFECGLQHEFDNVVVVDCAESIRISRIMLRNPHLTHEQIMSRIQAQMPQLEKVKLANHVISNNGNLQDLNSQVISLFHQLKNK